MIIKDEIYGDFEVSEKVSNIIRTDVVQRLKKIHQNGADFLINPKRKATRYDHSIGVMLLIKKLGGCEEEQIAGLLHDISHTVFSHTIDHVKDDIKQSYHEIIKDKFIKRTKIKEILSKLGFNPEMILEEKNYLILEKEQPDLCADRLDYLFRDMYNLGKITKEEIDHTISNLIFEDGLLKCKDKETAKKLFDRFIDLNLNVFFDSENEVANIILSLILKEMFKDKIIIEDDLLNDEESIIEKIRNSRYSKLFNSIKKDIKFKIVEKNDEKYNTKTHVIFRKLRHIDPIVKTENKRLTEIDEESKNTLVNYLKTPKKRTYYIDTNKLGGN
jgi:uncharacterized protein